MSISRSDSLSIGRGVSDLLKVVAALLVMFSHYYNLKATAGYVLNPVEWCIRSQGGNVGVAVFFFLSGYGLMMSEMRSHLSFSQFLRKRFLKVYLPVLLVTALWLPISYSITPPHKPQIFIDLAIGFRDPVLWFIKSLILLYISFFAFSIMLQTNRRIAIATLWVLTVLVCVISYFTNGAFGLNSISGIPLFSIGVIAALYSSKSIIRRLHISILPLILCFAAISVVMSFFPRFIANIAHVLADYSVVGILIIIFTNWRPEIKIPSILALITFDVYLVHFKVLTVMKSMTPTLPLLVFVAATLLCAIALYFIRNKIIKL